MKAPIDTIKNDGFAIMAGMIFFHTVSIGQKNKKSKISFPAD